MTSSRHDGVRFAFQVCNDLADVEAVLLAHHENLDLMVHWRSAV